MPPHARAIDDMLKTVSLGAPQNAVGFVMWRITHRYQREVDQALRPHDLTHLQFVTLILVAWMSREAGSASQAELGRFGDIHPMQVSTVMKALERKRLILRTAAPGHPLAKDVALTEAGLARLWIAVPLVVEVQRSLFGEAGRPGGGLLEALLRLEA